MIRVRTSLGDNTFLVGLFMFKEFRIAEVAINGRQVGNTELIQAHLQTGIRAFDSSRDLISITTFTRDIIRSHCTLKVNLLIQEKL